MENGDLHQRMATAYHEAGHAVMAFLLERQVHKITIEPGQMQAGGIRLGACRLQKGRAKGSHDPQEDEILFLLAGMVGESHWTQRYCFEGAAGDLSRVRRLLAHRPGSDRQRDRAERRLLDKAEYLLRDDGPARAIERIAKELVEKGTISGRAARHLFDLCCREE